MASTGPTVKERFYHGLKEYLVIAIYLWVVFTMFDIYKSVLDVEYHANLASKGFAVINALALGKIALIARELKLDARLRRRGKPLLYPTLLNAAAFAALMSVFKILEEVVMGVFHHHSVSQSIAEIGGSWKGTACLSVIFFVMLIPLSAFSELSFFLGEDKLVRLFLSEHTTS